MTLTVSDVVAALGYPHWVPFKQKAARKGLSDAEFRNMVPLLYEYALSSRNRNLIFKNVTDYNLGGPPPSFYLWRAFIVSHKDPRVRAQRFPFVFKLLTAVNMGDIARDLPLIKRAAKLAGVRLTVVPGNGYRAGYAGGNEVVLTWVQNAASPRKRARID